MKNLTLTYGSNSCQIIIKTNYADTTVIINIKERKIDMKNYQKPILDIIEVAVKENLSTLNEWLNGNGGDYANAGVTTFVIES